MSAQITIRHKRILRLREFPGRQDLPQYSTPLDISQRLEAILTEHLQARLGYCLVLPSVIALAEHLNVSVLALLKILQGLTQVGYQYEMSGLDSGIEIRVNPLQRYSGQYGLFSQGLSPTPDRWRDSGALLPLLSSDHSPLRDLTA